MNKRIIKLTITKRLKQKRRDPNKMIKKLRLKINENKKRVKSKKLEKKVNLTL